MIVRPFVRVGRPGLLGTAARTAVIAGTAAATAGVVRRGMSNREMQREEAAQYEAAQAQAQAQMAAAPVAPQVATPAAPTPPQGEVDDLVVKLQQLGQLRDSGVLTAAEFDAAKQKLLG